MNFISYDTAYLLYPRATFEARRNLALCDDSASGRRCLAKYARRGWCTVANIWPHSTPIARDFYLDVTWLCNDRRSWRIRLPTIGVDAPPLLSPTSEPFGWDPSKHNSWILTHTTTRWAVSPQCAILKSGVLRYAYTCGDVDLNRALTLMFDEEWDSQLDSLQDLDEASKCKAWTWSVPPSTATYTTHVHAHQVGLHHPRLFAT